MLVSKTLTYFPPPKNNNTPKEPEEKKRFIFSTALRWSSSPTISPLSTMTRKERISSSKHKIPYHSWSLTSLLGSPTARMPIIFLGKYIDQFLPIGSMGMVYLCIFPYIWLIFMVNVGKYTIPVNIHKYTIHGSYGLGCHSITPPRMLAVKVLQVKLAFFLVQA